MGDDSDDAWHARPATGDALALLYDRFAPALFRTACGLLGNAADAEDVVHDVFVALARNRTRLPEIVDARVATRVFEGSASSKRSPRRLGSRRHGMFD